MSGVPLVDAPTPLTPQEAADALRVSVSTVRRMLAQNVFPRAFRVGTKLIRIPESDIARYRHARRLAEEWPRVQSAPSAPSPRP